MKLNKTIQHELVKIDPNTELPVLNDALRTLSPYKEAIAECRYRGKGKTGGMLNYDKGKQRAIAVMAAIYFLGAGNSEMKKVYAPSNIKSKILERVGFPEENWSSTMDECVEAFRKDEQTAATRALDGLLKALHSASKLIDVVQRRISEALDKEEDQITIEDENQALQQLEIVHNLSKQIPEQIEQLEAASNRVKAEQQDKGFKDSKGRQISTRELNVG